MARTKFAPRLSLDAENDDYNYSLHKVAEDKNEI
jgi:hypothetical protein